MSEPTRRLSQITCTQIPNVFFDDWLPELREGEMRVMLYLMRHIYANQGKQTDRVSLTQLCDGVVREDGSRQDWGTGMQRKAVMRSLSSLEGRGLVEVIRSKALDGGNCTNEYRLR